MGIRIESVDLATAGDDIVSAVADLDVELRVEACPSEPPLVPATLIATYRNPPSFARMKTWLAWSEGGELAGCIRLRCFDRPDNRDQAHLAGGVRPSWRRQGIAGRLLLPPALDAAERDGRTILNFEIPEGGPGEPFMSAMGGQRKLRLQRNVLHVADLDRDLMRRWIDRAQERASDYSLIGWDGPNPSEHAEALPQLFHVMNSAPTDDLEIEDFVFTPELVRSAQQANEAQGLRMRTLVARHDPTGELAGFTELAVSKWDPTLGWQGDTGVDPPHRNRGLGRWLKASMILDRLAAWPDLERVETGNADSNEDMLSINVEMGFRTAMTVGNWQAPLATLQQAVAVRRAQGVAE
ncbi:MAG: GNAT family N-acetyltransferase [Catenulispora sp.]